MSAVAFLARASREYTRGGWVFTGFHWPVLAGETAARLAPERFMQLFEAGAVSHGPARSLPTSTTDFAAFSDALIWTGTTRAVFAGMVRRADRVVLDAANVDLHGAINATAIGAYASPTVRLAGGGGAADAAGHARELVLLHGAPTLERLVSRVQHATATPRRDAIVRLITRWGELRLDLHRPRLVAGDPEVDGFDRALDLLAGLGVEIDEPQPWAEPTEAERAAASEVLELAARRGYVVARRELKVV